jgi:hypothetical protein
MPDQPNTANEQERGKQDAPPPVRPSLIPEKGNGHDIQSPKKQEQHPSPQLHPSKPSRIKNCLHMFSKSEWITAFLTSVIAATGVVGIILVIQGGADTKRIRDAAEKQANAA